MRIVAASLAGLLLIIAAPLAHAFNGKVVIEIDTAAGSRLDVAAARRLIALELADIEVLPDPKHPKRPPAFFFRVLGDERAELRIELWERGEFYGARVVSGTATNRQLGARRVALGAAELLRGVRDRRRAETKRVERARRRERLLFAEAENKTREGPSALRGAFHAAVVPESELWLLGPSLAIQAHVNKHTRIDIAASLYSGFGGHDLRLEWSEISLGPARRFQLTRALDLDVGMRAAAALMRFENAAMVDGTTTSDTAWTARASGLLRLEPRLERNLRLSVGLEAGALLREVAFVPRRDLLSEQRVLGAWLGIDVGLIVTPLP